MFVTLLGIVIETKLEQLLKIDSSRTSKLLDNVMDSSPED